MRRTGDQYSIPLPTGRDGYIGRECPKCFKSFKIVNGTGLSGTTHCYCPYCGWKADHSYFHTTSQMDYAQSVVVNSITSDLFDSFKEIERKSKRQARRNSGFLNMTFEVKGQPEPIRYPPDFRLETYVKCTNCTLKYAVFGVYAFCPDCGQRNALQILGKNLDIAAMILELRDSADDSLRVPLTGNTSVVAAFDGFGREVCRATASKSSSPSKAEKIRFQNLARARVQVKNLFGFDTASAIRSSDWGHVDTLFSKASLVGAQEWRR